MFICSKSFLQTETFLNKNKNHEDSQEKAKQMSNNHLSQNKTRSQEIGNWADTTAKHALTLKMDPSGAPLVQILVLWIQQQVVASAFGRSRGRRNDQWDYAGHTLLPRCTQGWPPGLVLGLYKAGMYQAPHGYSFTRAPVHDAHILLLQHLHHCCSIPTFSSSSSSR